jgi:hypothetical protein
MSKSYQRGGRAADRKPGGYKVTCLSLYHDDLAALDAAASAAKMCRSEFVRHLVRAWIATNGTFQTHVTTTVVGTAISIHPEKTV